MAIEVSSLQFSVNNLWKAFFCSTICILVIKSSGAIEKVVVFPEGTPYFYDGNTPIGIDAELPFFALLGVICGVVGSYYIKFQRSVNTWRRENRNLLCFRSNWIYPTMIGAFVLNIIYLTKMLQVPDAEVIRSMLDVDMTIAKMNLTSTTAIWNTKFQLSKLSESFAKGMFNFYSPF
jgi:H+/Cl- antiporter ClcA